MMADTERYIVERNVHGECDLTGLDGTLVKVVGGYYLSPDVLPVIDSRADALVYSDDSDFDDMEEAFKHVLDEHVGKTLILHYASGDSPSGGHTHSVDNVDSFEIEWGDENTVKVRKVGGDRKEFTATGLTVSGMS